MTSRRFGRFRFELPARELFLDGAPVALQRRTGELLELLVERAPALVPRDEIFARLWPAGFVEDGNLFQHVYTLRRALAADPAVRVETVRGRGYRLAFTAAAPALPATVAPPAPHRRVAWFAPQRRFAARAAALAVALTLLAGAVPAPTGSERSAQRRSALAEPAATAELARALAIDPDDATAHEWSGVALLYAGRLADATVAFREAVRLDPSSSTNLYWLGVAELYAGRFADARWTLEQSRSLDGRPFERLEALVAEQTSAELAGDRTAAARSLEPARNQGDH